MILFVDELIIRFIASKSYLKYPRISIQNDIDNELENAKNKIHTLKIKLSTKELDIMNLKKEQICLILEYNEYKIKQEQQEQILEQEPITVNNTNIYITE